MIRDHQAIQKTCFIKGHQRKISTDGKNAGVKLMGILDYVTRQVYCEEYESDDVTVYERFLKTILGKYPTGKIVMILDNVKIHHAKLLQPLLYGDKQRLKTDFLATIQFRTKFNRWVMEVA